jgi:uncharacterized protein YjdB
VGSILLSPPNATLVPQQTLQIAATVLDPTGSVLNGRTVTWASEASGVASVNPTGLVTAVSAGTAGIVATSEGKSSTASMLVREGIYAGPAGGQAVAAGGNVTLTIPAAALTTNTAITIAAFAVPPDPRLIPGTAFEFGPEGTQFNQAVTIKIKYSASQVPPGTSQSLLRLGRLIGNNWSEVAGSSVDVPTLTVTGQTSSFSVYGAIVSQAPVASVSVAPAASSVSVGGSTQLSATLRDAANNILTGRTVTWSSSNSAVASVGTSTGLVSGAAAGGPVTITATSEGVSGTAQVTVTSPVATVTVSPTPNALQVGETVQLAAVLRDAALNILTDRPVSWVSESPGVATVSTTGLVTAVASGGPINIVASSEGKSGTAQVTVNAPVATVDIMGASRIKVGDQYSYTAVPRDAQGNILTKTVVWSIVETPKGTMSPGGTLVASQTGTITIRAVIDGQNWDQPVTAYDWTVNGLTLSLEADNELNGGGGPEFLRLVIACSGGAFQVSVTSTGFTMNAAVQYRITGGPLVNENWVLIDNNHSVQHPGGNAAQKAFTQSLAGAQIMSWVFTSGGTIYGSLFRVTGLGGFLTPVMNGCP